MASTRTLLFADPVRRASALDPTMERTTNGISSSRRAMSYLSVQRKVYE
jgi:hypothetical protein